MCVGRFVVCVCLFDLCEGVVGVIGYVIIFVVIFVLFVEFVVVGIVDGKCIVICGKVERLINGLFGCVIVIFFVGV